MTKLIIRLFIKDPDNTSSPQVREAYGIMCAFVGIIANLLLCVSKFFVGLWSGSIAIQADAVNNLSDIGSSVVTLIGFKAAGRPADAEHPYGHARMEYVAALVVSFFILMVGFALGKESIAKIASPAEVTYTPVTMIVLALSIFVKLWMSAFTRSVGKRINSTALTATTLDSLCDVISTGAILVSTIIGYFFNINLDGYFGLLVALFVLYAGIGILRDTISPLMGEAPDQALVKALQERVCSYDGVLGVHDMMIHSYGPGRTIATIHAEVSQNANILEIHETIDHIEREVGDELNMLLTIHLDPLCTDDEVCNAARAQVAEAVQAEDERLSFHDFRMVTGEAQTNLIFDLVVPYSMPRERIPEIKAGIRRRMSAVDPTFNCVITADWDFTGGKRS